MSLKTAYLQSMVYFYAVGNTPAVCLTQSLPPDEDAKLLLLGCGDVRNVLFTAYAGNGINARKLDFTCCDLVSEIIARNIVILSLIVDDTDGSKSSINWNTYYHVFLDKESLLHLQVQARKLVSYGTSLEAWHSSPYGRLFRFCDSTTFDRIVRLWKFYTFDASEPKAYKEQQHKLKAQWKAAQDHHRFRFGQGGFATDNLRAILPVLAPEALSDAEARFKLFWKTGTLFEDKSIARKHKLLNPMFICLRGGLVLHYGTEPLGGFHLAPTHAALSASSPLKQGITSLQVAMGQFSAWSEAFRNSQSQITLRFVNADAIAVCHVLRHQHIHCESRNAHWYRSTLEYTSLELDSDDYSSDGPAPTSFNVIDCSNLMDHLGSLNILSACTPLLASSPTSVLRTEMLIPREGSISDSAKLLLCGELSSTALILGLVPVQFWSNSTAVWNITESAFDEISLSESVRAVLSKQVILWRPVDTGTIRYNSNDLANFLLSTYLNMFQDESWAHQFSNLGISGSQLERKFRTFDLYTRASLGAVLCALRASESVQITPLVDKFIEHILQDHSLIMGPHYLQSFIVFVYNLGLSDLKASPWFFPAFFRHNLSAGPFSRWKDIPPVVSVTLAVPRSAVRNYQQITNETGGFICHMSLMSSRSPKQNFFSDVQLGFGSILTSGTPFTNEYSIEIQEDELGWEGNKALLATAMVPVASLVDYGDHACRVSLELKSDMRSTTLIPELGLELRVYGSAIGRNDVFVTKFRPNLRGNISVCCPRLTPRPIGNRDFYITISPGFDETKKRITSLRIRYEVVGEVAKSALLSGATVQVQSLKPFTLNLDIGSGLIRQVLRIPVPISLSQGKTKIARKSGWIEYSAPVCDQNQLATRPDAMFPIDAHESSTIFLENLHYVHASVLPSLDPRSVKGSTHWVYYHVSRHVFSPAEQALHLGAEDPKDFPKIAVKLSIQALLGSFLGIGGHRKSTLFNVAGGLLLVSALRMDLSNNTLFLDAALIANPRSVPAEKLKLMIGKPIMVLDMGEGEKSFWKHLLPAFAERCRLWNHRLGCEYHRQGKVPLSPEGEGIPVCSCGFGVFPANFINNPKCFADLAEHAVRVAIPMCYPSPINDCGMPASFPPRSPSKAAASKSKATGGTLQDLDAKKGKCFECGARNAKNGETLLKCARCKFAQYCSPECQRTDWKKEHKHICEQLKGMIDD